MKKFLSGLVIGFIIFYCVLNFGQIKQWISKTYQNTSSRYKQKSRVEEINTNKTLKRPEKTKTTTHSENLTPKKKVSPLFEDIPEQIVEPETSVTQETVKTKNESDTFEDQSEAYVPGLLQTLRGKGKLNYTQEYDITNEEQSLYRKYKQLQKDYEQKTKDQYLSMSQIKKYKTEHENQLQKLAVEYSITTEQLSEFEKYMKRL